MALQMQTYLNQSKCGKENALQWLQTVSQHQQTLPSNDYYINFHFLIQWSPRYTNVECAARRYRNKKWHTCIRWRADEAHLISERLIEWNYLLGSYMGFWMQSRRPSLHYGANCSKRDDWLWHNHRLHQLAAMANARECSEYTRQHIAMNADAPSNVWHWANRRAMLTRSIFTSRPKPAKTKKYYEYFAMHFDIST